MSFQRAMKRAYLWVPPFACMAAIFYLSSQSNPLPEVTSRISDKVLHACAYAVLAALYCRALFGEGVGSFTTIALAVLMASAYGASDELHQAFVPGRHPDVADWIVDTLGAAIGVIGQLLGPRVRGCR